MHLATVADLLDLQRGVVSRRQLHERGFAKHDLDRLVRRRELTRVHPGVFVDHTGDLTTLQRQWAAILYAAPAALHLGSALDLPTPGGLVHVAIDERRTVRAQPGMRVHRVADLDRIVHWQASPPRVRVEEAALEIAHRARSELDVVAVLADVVNRRLTTADRLKVALERRLRMARRRFVERLLDDLGSGVCSVLEHAFLVRVERAHGLPASDRQVVRTGRGGREYRDAGYPAYRTVVELDGWLGHSSWAAGARDAERDLADVAAGWTVVRLRWQQVLDRPCETAGKLGRALAARGWPGAPRPCGAGCRLSA
ncbi:type IV toxin-antitoxin system AbiEi family antitoxin domain-containing protein [Nocardioides ferulae]|uniref:type IV toxin-antitoxin system AbiEi family antitoxin domain-containing protein n=1 Tax=Nocardioides ferulae TaxID=2340821 RepID=UPI000EB0A8B3|nr:type IV toxin-antitoxin system AbiEi family antitoxin domain-containing protein [Nocardioides ferulae]